MSDLETRALIKQKEIEVHIKRYSGVAYRVHNIKDTFEQAEWAWTKTRETLIADDPETYQAIDRMAGILLARKIIPKHQRADDELKINYLDDLEEQYALPGFGPKGRSTQFALGDFRVEQVEALSRLKAQNITAVQRENDRWIEARDLVLPVMKDRGCTWRDACTILKQRGLA